MKKLLILTAVLAVAAMAMVGCAFIFGETYILDDGSRCTEIETSNTAVILLLEVAEYETGNCSDEDLLGTCTYIDEDLEDTEAIDYYYDSYSLGAEYAESVCDGVDGTWEAAR